MKLVFVHGSGGCRESWQFQTEHFAGSLAIDLPGHPNGELCRTIPQYTNWLRRELNPQTEDPVVLVGHSMGGGIALQFALDYPDALAGIVLVGSGGRLRVDSGILTLFESAVANPEVLNDYNAIAYENIAPDLVRTIIHRSEENTPKAFLNDFKACDQFDVLDQLEKIRVPTLAIVGEQDFLAPPKYAQFIADNVVNGAVGVVPESGHFVQCQRPAEFNQMLDHFVQTLNAD